MATPLLAELIPHHVSIAVTDMDLAIEPVAAEAALSLLQAAKLPTADIVPGAAIAFYGVQQGAELAGVVALERLGAHGLLRSLVVAPSQRAAGIGRALVQFIEQRAAALGLAKLHLLTTDASGYFQQLGYVAIPRSAAPEAIARSSQFAALCPDSAILMEKPVVVSEGVKRG
jgi:amino-acid N-acetyltransferase